MTLKQLGKRYIALRKEKGYTKQSEFASAIGLQAPKISELENGRREMTLTELKVYHKHFNVSYEYLLGEATTSSNETNVQNACELTGLNDLSFFRLQHIKNTQNQMDIFNELVSPLLFEELLNNINTLIQQTVELKSIEKEYPNFKDEEIKADLSQCCCKEEFEARQTHQSLKLSTFTSRYIIEEQFKKLYLLAVEAQTE